MIAGALTSPPWIDESRGADLRAGVSRIAPTRRGTRERSLNSHDIENHTMIQEEIMKKAVMLVFTLALCSAALFGQCPS